MSKRDVPYLVCPFFVANHATIRSRGPFLVWKQFKVTFVCVDSRR